MAAQYDVAPAPQVTCPAPHAQTPEVHVAPAPHARPQLPQLLASAARSTHAPLHAT